MKPSVGLQLLRQEILGPAAFDDAFRTYIAALGIQASDAGRLLPHDGRRGRPAARLVLARVVHGEPRFDQAIDTVRHASRATRCAVRVMYGNRARGVLPIHARFTFSDGSVENFNYPAEVWSTNTSQYFRDYAFPKKVSKIELDPEHRLVDIDRSNNTWTR